MADLNQKIEILTKNNSNLISLEKAYEKKYSEYDKLNSEHNEMKMILSSKEEYIKILDEKIKFLETNNENLKKKDEFLSEIKIEDAKSFVIFNIFYIYSLFIFIKRI